MRAYLRLKLHSTPDLGWTYDVFRQTKRGNWGMWAYGYSTKATAKSAALELGERLGLTLTDIGDQLWHEVYKIREGNKPKTWRDKGYR